MARSNDVNTLPDGLPVPIDDGACDHLDGMVLPTLELRATSGRMVDLSKITGAQLYISIRERAVPMKSRP